MYADASKSEISTSVTFCPIPGINIDSSINIKNNAIAQSNTIAALFSKKDISPIRAPLSFEPYFLSLRLLLFKTSRKAMPAIRPAQNKTPVITANTT